MINVSIGVIKPLIIFGSTLSNHLYSGTADQIIISQAKIIKD